MIRFLIISFLSSLLLISCSLKTTEGLRKVNVDKIQIENLYFSNAAVDYIYKARVEVYNKKFGGILIVKKIAPESYRIVFTTEFGSKLFDFQFEGDKFTRNFVIEDLDKKFIINILRDDFKLLLNEKAEVLEVFASDMQNVYKTQDGSRFNFYFIDRKSERLEKIVNTSKTKEKVEIGFISSEIGAGEFKETIADTIAITHKNIELKIDLKKFKKE